MNAGIVTVKMPSREIQWPTLIGLQYDEFRAKASGIFSLYKKKSFIIVVKCTETFVFKKAIVQLIKEINIY